jgi:hypothetical protein
MQIALPRVGVITNIQKVIDHGRNSLINLNKNYRPCIHEEKKKKKQLKDKYRN